jgi:hypothetical protein
MTERWNGATVNSLNKMLWSANRAGLRFRDEDYIKLLNYHKYLWKNFPKEVKETQEIKLAHDLL